MALNVPPHREPGQDGHTDDHDLISDALLEVSDFMDDMTSRLQVGRMIISDTEPENPQVNDVWFDTSGAT